MFLCMAHEISKLILVILILTKLLLFGSICNYITLCHSQIFSQKQIHTCNKVFIVRNNKETLVVVHK